MSSKFEGAGYSEAGPNHPHLHQHCGYNAIDMPRRQNNYQQTLFYIYNMLDALVGIAEQA
jgi:hypothetical protein